MKKHKQKKIEISHASVITKTDKYEFDFIKFYIKSECYNFVTTKLIGVSFPISLVIDCTFSDVSEEKRKGILEVLINENKC